MKKILNFGSLNIDKRFAVDHIVGPGETLAAEQLTLFPGGKGLNQSVAFARAGGQVYHAGKIGADGQFLLDTLQNAGVDTTYVAKTDGQTGQALIQVDRAGQNCILLYHGANFEITEEEICNALAHFGEGDLLVLQNEINGLNALMEQGRRRKMEIAFNPSPIGPEIEALDLSAVTWFLLNEIEGFALTGEKVPQAIADALLQKYPQAKIVLTLGEQGVIYRDATQTCAHQAYPVPVVDTTAAGDTFTGYFLCMAAAGEPIPQALKLASIASSIAVSRKGAAVSIPALEEVRQRKQEEEAL